MVFAIGSFREGGLMQIDHRASPGNAQVPEGKFAELKTLACNHCKTVQIINPLRTRERGHCSRCDAYICDPCAAHYHATKLCRTWDKVADDLFDGKTPIPIIGRNMR
jgi:hypothetical protein